jgi:hypothetical protein
MHSVVAVASDRPAYARLFLSWPCVAFLLAVLPLSVLLFFDRGLFVPDTRLGWMDAWYYVGFVRWLPYYVNRLWFVYQSERIGWTLPAYVAKLIAGPLVGNYAVKSAFYIATIFFLFGSIRQLCSDRAAVLVSILAAFHTFVVHSLGAGYSDGPANTYFLAAVFFLNRAVLSERVRLIDSVLAGLCLAGQLFAHFGTILLLPIVAGYAMSVRLTRFRTLNGLAAAFLGCCAGILLGWEAVNRLYVYWGVPSLPLLDSLQILWSHQANPLVWPIGLSWVGDATWLVVPAGVLVWAIISVVVEFKRGSFSVAAVHPYLFLMIAASSVWLALYVVARSPLIMLPFYASCLLPPMFLALGALISDMTSVFSRPVFYALLLLTFCFGALTYVGDLFPARFAIALSIGLLTAAVGLNFVKARVVLFWATASTAALLFGVLALNPATKDYGVLFRDGYKHSRMVTIYGDRAPAPDRQTQAQRFLDALRAADILQPRLDGRRYSIAYNNLDEYGPLFRSVGSLLFAEAGNVLLSQSFRDFTTADDAMAVHRTMTYGRDLVVLTRAARLDPNDDNLQPEWTQELHELDTPYFVHYFKLRSRD